MFHLHQNDVPQIQSVNYNSIVFIHRQQAREEDGGGRWATEGRASAIESRVRD